MSEKLFWINSPHGPGTYEYACAILETMIADGHDDAQLCVDTDKNWWWVDFDRKSKTEEREDV